MGEIQNSTGSLEDLMGEDYYGELQLKSLVDKADKGDFMPSLHTWLKQVNPDFNWDWNYIKYIIDHLQMLSDGKIRKLMISLPPRSGKSELASIHFPTYFLEKDPRNRVIVGTYNATLAQKVSRRIRSLSKTRFDLNPDRKAMDDWETKLGGGVRAVGTGGGIAGVGANLIILDDVVRSRKDANSITVRNTTFSWYTDDIYTRLEPDSRICLIGTRWSQDDIIGRVQRYEDDWTIINLPALAVENDPLGRKVGEALNPERFSRESLLEIKKVLGRGFTALYQGNPHDQETGMIKGSWIREHLVKSLPIEDGIKYEFVRYWDLASSLDGDYTVGALLAKDRISGEIYIVDIVRGRWNTTTRDQKMIEVAAKDRGRYGDYGNVRQLFEQQPGSAGKDVAKFLTKMLSGFSVKAIKVTGSKEHRAEPLANQFEAGNITTIDEPSWLEILIDEMVTFPLGKNDDIVDACSGAFSSLSKGASFISIGSRFFS